MCRAHEEGTVSQRQDALANREQHERHGGATTTRRRATATTAARAALPETMNGKPVYEVTAKSIVNFASKFGHKLLCDDLTFSTGAACAYICDYCYVEPLMAKSLHLAAVRQINPSAKHGEIIIRRAKPFEVLRSQLFDRHGKPKFSAPADTRVIYASHWSMSRPTRNSRTMLRMILEATPWHIRLLSKSIYYRASRKPSIQQTPANA